MKLCGRCFIVKPLEEFSFKNKSKGLYGSYCKLCNQQYQRTHYTVHRSAYLKKVDQYRKKRDEENQSKMVQYLLKHPCVDCGEPDIRVLEFDHTGKKSAPISKLFSDSRSWECILTEIKQCEVRCANCHKRKTAHQFNWYKANYKINSQF